MTPSRRLRIIVFEVEPYATPIVRYGQPESVIIVARRDNEVIYWEDVEEGFNASPVDENGTILEHWCNQDQLGHALNAWVEGRSLPGKSVRLAQSRDSKWQRHVSVGRDPMARIHC